jgi:hypothetical protein
VYRIDVAVIQKIISGGQRGADRAALDWAVATVFRMAAGARKAAGPKTGGLMATTS